MSLINDALKQARQAQAGSAVPAEGPTLRPVESPHEAAGHGLLLPAIIVCVLLLGVVLIWGWFRGGNGELKARANARQAIAAGSLPMRAAAAEPASTPEAASAPAPAPLVPPATANVNPTNTSTATATNSVTNETVLVEAAKPLPAVYKLQSLFYRAKNPSAVINNKTIFLGSRVGEARVAAIDKESVTIVTSAGQTNILELGN
jgi:hypothetical protein